MNKKTYNSPAIHVVKIDNEGIMAASINARIGEATGSQYSKRRGNTFFDDDYDEE